MGEVNVAEFNGLNLGGRLLSSKTVRRQNIFSYTAMKAKNILMEFLLFLEISDLLLNSSNKICTYGKAVTYQEKTKVACIR